MSINSAVVDLRIPADPSASEHADKLTAVIRRLVRRPRCSQVRPYLNIGDSYRIPDGCRGGESGSKWVHTHH